MTNLKTKKKKFFQNGSKQLEAEEFACFSQKIHFQNGNFAQTCSWSSNERPTDYQESQEPKAEIEC